MADMHAQRQKALERLQKNLKEEYRAVVDYEVAFFNTVSWLGLDSFSALRLRDLSVLTFSCASCALIICLHSTAGKVSRPTSSPHC